MSNKTPIRVDASFTPSGTQDVNIVSSITLAISAASLPLPTGAATETTLAAVLADLNKFTFASTRLLIDGSGVTQPVSGTVTANQGTSPWIVSGTITTSPDVNVHDGTGVSISSTGSSLNVDVTNTVPVTGPLTDTQLRATPVPISGTVTANQGTSPWVTSVSNFPATVAVTQSTSPWVVSLASTTITGTVSVTQGTSPWVVSGTVTANAGTNLNTSLLLLDSTFTGRINTLGQKTSANSTPVVIASDQSAIPVSGTVTANIGTTNGLALDATLTGGTQKTKIVDTGGTNVASVSAAGAVKVDGSAVTQPISATSLPLPTGASTAALQTQPGVDIGDVTVNNTSGAGAVNIQDGGNSITVDGTVAVTQSTTPWVSNITQFGSSNVVTGTGASGVGIPRVTVSNDSNILATQSGTWTVQPGNTPNTAPWLIEQRAPGTLTTYSASTLGLTTALLATDIFTIYGSGTKTVKVTRIEISATENTAAIRDIILVKRSATNTGGTSASVTAVSHDSNNAGATATVLSYTANPSALGAAVGNVRTGKMDVPATNLTGSADRIVWTFADRPSQAVVLRGTSQGLTINLNGVTLASSSFDINIEWSEE